MLMLSCHAGEFRYTISALDVAQVTKAVRPKPIPGMPQAVLGGMRIREHWIPLLDLGFLTIGSMSQPRVSSRILVISRVDQPSFGLICERVSETTTLPDLSAPEHLKMYEDRGVLVRFCDPYALLGAPLILQLGEMNHVL